MDKFWTDSNNRAFNRPLPDAATQPVVPGRRAAESLPPDGLRRRFALSLEQRGDNLLIHLHPGRQKVMAAVAAGIGCLFAAAAILLPELLPDPGPDAGLFQLAFAVFAVGLLLTAIYLPSNGVELQINTQLIIRLRLCCGVVIRRQQISPQQIQRIKVDSSVMQSAPGYRLTGRGDFGSLPLVEGINDRLLIETLRQQIITAAGLSRERLAAD